MKKIWNFVKILLLVLLITIIITIITDIAFKIPILKRFTFNENQLEPFILTVTLITALIGVVYSAKLDREAQKHSESSWRKKLLEFEQKPYYTIEDLFVLNSFINPYNKKGIDKEINEELVTIARHYIEEKDKTDTIKMTQNKTQNKTQKKEKNNNEKKNKRIKFSFSSISSRFEKKEQTTLFNFQYKQAYIDNYLSKNEEYKLKPEDMTTIRVLAHKLLKDDWKKY